MLNRHQQALIALNIGIALSACYDGNDLKGTDAPPWSQPPDIHGRADGGVVATVQQAVIGAGMRSCSVAPEQQPGEVVINKLNGWWEETPGNIDQCLILAVNGDWDVCSPALNWYDGQILNDNIRLVKAWVPSGKTLRIRLYYDWMYGGGTFMDETFTGPTNVYRNVNAYTSSIRTDYY